MFVRLVLPCLLSLLVQTSSEPAPGQAAKNITGYVVAAQWALSMKTKQYSLQVTRQGTAVPPLKQEVVFQELLPPVDNPVGVGTVFTGFDPVSRFFFTTVANGTGETANILWGTNISKDANSSNPLSPQSVGFALPQEAAVMVALEAVNIGGPVQVFAVYESGEVVQIDWRTGKTSLFAHLADSTSRKVTPAIAVDHTTKRLYAITEALEGQPVRNISTLDLSTGKISSIELQPLQFEKPFEEVPFQMVWVDKLQVLLQFQTGPFDQLKYVNASSGEQSFAFFDLSQFRGTEGDFEIQANQGEVNDDTWKTLIVAPEEDTVYFQCSDTDPDSGMFTTTLVYGPIYDKAKTWAYVDAAVEPFQYGYAGFQYVPIIA